MIPDLTPAVPDPKPSEERSPLAELAGAALERNSDRRAFMGELASLFVSGSNIVQLATKATALRSVIPNEFDEKAMHAAVKSLEIYLESNRDLRGAASGLNHFHKARRAIADTIDISGEIPILNADAAKKAVAGLFTEEMRGIAGAIKARSAALAELHGNQAGLKQFCALFFHEGETPVFGNLSAVLASENESLTPHDVQRILREEAQEITFIAGERFNGAGKGALSTTNLYETSSGVKVYRHVDGSFGFEHDKRWDEQQKQREKVRGAVADFSGAFSPEMYMRSHLPPSPYSLETEHSVLTQALKTNFIKHVEERSPQFADEYRMRLTVLCAEHLVSTTDEKVAAYMKLVKEMSQSPGSGGNGLEKQFLENPRAGTAHAMYGYFLSMIDFEHLPEQASILGIRFRAHTLSSLWAGPFAIDKYRYIVHDVIADSVTELAEEGKLFFQNHRVSSLAEFKDISKAFSHTPEFSGAFLPIYDRVLDKRVNLSGYFNAVMSSR